MKRYSGLVIERGQNRTYRALRAKRGFEANTPTHATMQLEPEIPGRPKVLLTVDMNHHRLAPGTHEELSQNVLSLFGASGIVEIDPSRLYMVAAITEAHGRRRTYLLAVAPHAR